MPGLVKRNPREPIASGVRAAISVTVMAYAALLFIPLSIALRYLVDAPPTWVFLTSAAARSRA